ncbi:MAG: hypothetical protein H6642_13755 [Caldilineaceae bacterium]|nr:hypothetical protein [Caldilineaceae bacterium]
MQWNAETVRPRPAYRRCRQDDLPVAGEGELALVTGTVAYDGGTLFRLTQAMRDMIHAAAVTLNPDDDGPGRREDNDAVLVRSAHGELRLRRRQRGNRARHAWIPESLPGAPVGALLNKRAGIRDHYAAITVRTA